MKYEKNENPFTLQFSYIPPQYIQRSRLMEDIISDLTRKIPTHRCHFITGVRGSGKTVMMMEISRKVGELEDWITVNIDNPEGNILDELARNLYRIPELNSLFINAKIDFSKLGIGLTIEKAKLIASNEQDALRMMLDLLKKKKKKILVTIDEITYSEDVASFSHALSSFAGLDYDIFVIMTGLKENIKEIKNKKSLTFLYRARDNELVPLNITSIIMEYMEVFEVDREQIEEMAWQTKGYSFAFQVLGYLYWENLSEVQSFEKIKKERILLEYDKYLSEYVYEKIWEEMSAKDKKIVKTMADFGLEKVDEIREKLKLSSNEFTVYRTRLIDKGIVKGQEYGVLKFKLPRFDEFVKNYTKYEN